MTMKMPRMRKITGGMKMSMPHMPKVSGVKMSTPSFGAPGAGFKSLASTFKPTKQAAQKSIIKNTLKSFINQ